MEILLGLQCTYIGTSRLDSYYKRVVLLRGIHCSMFNVYDRVNHGHNKTYTKLKYIGYLNRS